MMDLILWRHAEAEDGQLGMSDMKRCLTPRGEKQARLVGNWLRDHLPRHARVLVSPALRTQQTVLPLDRPYKTVERLGTGASATDLLAAAGWPDAGDAVVLVGHQPTLGELASLLLFGAETDLTVKKGAAWWISAKDDGQPFLRAVVAPDLL